MLESALERGFYTLNTGYWKFSACLNGLELIERLSSSDKTWDLPRLLSPPTDPGCWERTLLISRSLSAVLSVLFSLYRARTFSLRFRAFFLSSSTSIHFYLTSLMRLCSLSETSFLAYSFNVSICSYCLRTLNSLKCKENVQVSECLQFRYVLVLVCLIVIHQTL